MNLLDTLKQEVKALLKELESLAAPEVQAAENFVNAELTEIKTLLAPITAKVKAVKDRAVAYGYAHAKQVEAEQGPNAPKDSGFNKPIDIP